MKYTVKTPLQLNLVIELFCPPPILSVSTECKMKGGLKTRIKCAFAVDRLLTDVLSVWKRPSPRISGLKLFMRRNSCVTAELEYFMFDISTLSAPLPFVRFVSIVTFLMRFPQHFHTYILPYTLLNYTVSV